MSGKAAEPRYADLVTLAEVELDLVRAGDFDALPSVQAAWQELVAQLPEQPPAGAATHLRRASVLNHEARALLDGHVRSMRESLGRLDHGRRALEGYAPEGLRRRVRVDQAG